MNKSLFYASILVVISLNTCFYKTFAQVANKEHAEVLLLIDSSLKLSQTKPDSSLILALRADILSQNLGNLELMMKSQYQLGYVYYSLNRFDEAIKHFENSLQLAIKTSNREGEAMALNRLGNVFQLKTNYLQALDYYLSALDINKRIGNQAEVARTLGNLANVYSVIGQYQRSIEHFLEALNIHESMGEREGLAWTSLGIARLFKRLELLDKAMQYTESALVYYREIEHQTGKTVGVTLCLNELAGIYHKMGNFERAMEYNRMVLEINEKNGNIHGQASNHLTLGVIYLEKNNYDLAHKHLLNALALKEQVGDSLDLSLLYRHLGEVEMRKNNHKQALLYLNLSLKFAKEHRLIPDLSEAYLSLSQIYTRIGEYKKALENYSNHSAYKDSLNSSEISRLEMQYEFEKREKEQELIARQREALQELRIERQRAVLVFFVIAFLLAGSLAGYIFYVYREKKRTNQILIAQNNEISRQKKEIENQRDEIELQRDYVTRQRDQIAEQQRLITDSIMYASRIQNAVLPSKKSFEILPWESFVFYKPKNIVSGDFYWVSELSNGNFLIAVADCTGHGVPGAFMSMLGITLLREIVGKHKHHSPAQMLNELRKMVINSLNQQAGQVEQADGMDMAITIIDPRNLEMVYSGAYLSALVVRAETIEAVDEIQNPRIFSSNGLSVLEFKGKKMPIGYHVLPDSAFEDHKFQLEKGDMLYLFSDGYIDQFGGEKNIKFLMQNFKELLISVNQFSPDAQKEKISTTIATFQGDNKQVDDMLVLGVRIS